MIDRPECTPVESSAGTSVSNTHSFRRRIKIGIAFVVVLAGSITIVSLLALRSVIAAKDRVYSEYVHDLLLTRELELASEQNAASSRAFLLTGDARYLEKAQSARERFSSRLDALRTTTPLPEESRLLNGVVQAAHAHQAAMDEAISAERLHGGSEQIAEMFEATVRPRREALLNSLGRLVHEKDRLLKEAAKRSRSGSTNAMILVATLGGAAAALASVLYYLSTRALIRLGLAESEIRDLNNNLEKRVRDRTREIEGFAYTVAHDLRAPLRAMAGFSDLLLQEPGPGLEESRRDSLRRIHKAARRMDDLIQGILSLARLSYQHFSLFPVDISSIIQETVASKQGEILAANARVELETPLVRVLGHPSLLALSLDHLLSNALKFVSCGIAPRIHVRVQARGLTARISISDNGIGIPAEYRSRIFGVFERLHSTEAFPGVGIGLALVRRALERMGGVVGVLPNAEGGTTFWFELNVAAAAKATPDALPANSGAG